METSPGLAADPSVPFRDRLLDPHDVAERLSRLCGFDGDLQIDDCRLRRVDYRLGESLCVVYDVRVGDRTLVLSARTFSNSAAVFRHAGESASPVELMPGVVHDPEANAVWWTVPKDPKMTNLGTLLDAPMRVRLASGVAWDQSTLVEYTPERSATACVVDAKKNLVGYAKAYRDRDVLEVANQYDQLANSLVGVDEIRTPRALGWARLDRIVVLEPLPGIARNELPMKSQPGAMRRFGSALANIHQLPTDGGAGRRQPDRFKEVTTSADLIAAARPGLSTVVRRLGDRLAGGPANPRSIVSLHGDVSAANVLHHGEQVHMIDFVPGRSGAAAADLGSLLASLATARRVDPGASVDGLGAALLDGYSLVRSLPTKQELCWYTAAAILAERAIGAVNTVDERSLAVLAELFDIAEAACRGNLPVEG